MTLHRCPNCGFMVDAKKNRAGQGASYASRITKLGRRRSTILAALQGQVKKFPSKDAAHGPSWSMVGVTSREIWAKERELCITKGLTVSPRSGTTGRLAELVGLGLVRMLHAGTTEPERAGEHYRQKGGPPKYVLTERGVSAPTDPNWNPQEALVAA